MNPGMDQAELRRLEAMILVQHRRLVELEKAVGLVRQAILELDSAFRRSGVPIEGFGALSLRSETENPDRPSADEGSTVST